MWEADLEGKVRISCPYCDEVYKTLQLKEEWFNAEYVLKRMQPREIRCRGCERTYKLPSTQT